MWLVSLVVVKSRTLKFVKSIVAVVYFTAGMFVKSRRWDGDEGTRTPDLCLAKAPLSQLSYIPVGKTCGSDRTRTYDLTLIRRAL